MRILLANKFFYLKGGAENSFFQTAQLLESKGHEIAFFSMQDKRNFSSKYGKYFIEPVDYDSTKGLMNTAKECFNILYSMESRNKMNPLLEEFKPEVAHLNNIYHQISPSILHSLKKSNIPVIMTLRDYKLVCASYSMLFNGHICEDCKNGRFISIINKKCVKGSKAMSFINAIEMYLHHKIMHIYDIVDVFISPSRFLIDKVHEMGFKRNIQYLPNFVKAEDYKPHFDWQEKSIVYFGRLSKEKGLYTLLEAVKGVDVTQKIVGEGPMKKSLKSIAQKHELRNVKFLEYKNGIDLKNELTSSMFVVLPSECYENNPRSIIEAFALGKPVIGSKIGGIPELVKNGITGLTFTPGDAEDLRSKIEFMIKNPSKIIEMGANAREFVEKELNAEKHYKGLMRIYKEAATSKQR